MERHVAVSACFRAPVERVRSVLIDDPAAAFEPERTGADRRSGPFTVPLSVDLGGGTVLTQRVVVELGPVEHGDNALTVPIGWRPAGHKRVFPTFAGHLSIADHDGEVTVTVEGTYQVPLGVIGAFGEGVLGRRVARSTVSALAGTIADRLSAACAAAAPGWIPPPAPPRAG